MSAIVILNGLDPFLHTFDFHEQVSEIFFESSTKKDFSDLREKKAFAWKYLDFYITHYPQYLWVALDGQNVLGYILGMPFTLDSSLYSIQPHLKKFENLFSDFPAHLHINCHHEARGKGIGGKLVQRFIEQLNGVGLSGVHIMTGAESRNRDFYRKLGFHFELIQDGVCFMGLNLK
jgi:GNAT superfamily N-acetyltransferase